MTDDIARLVVAVDSTSAASASKNLDNLTAAGNKTAQSQDQVAKSAGRAKQSMSDAAAAAGEYTKTANELRFATRGLPAQFTDIAVSLQAGQNPLTVFLQQGGQLKDMFGGVGPAAKAMGGYILGLINPVTIAAAALVTLGAAWHSGEAEASGFQKAIAQVGDTAGVTSDQLMNLAASTAGGINTQHQMAGALAEVVASGKIASSQYAVVAEAAVNMERATGQSVEDTVKAFAKLGDEPTEAVAKLNAEFHFLTAAQYENIKALEEQGKTQDAARLATEAYADAVNARTKDVLESLGTLEKGWFYLKVGASAAWDAMLGVGRDTTGADKITELHEKLLEIENPSSFMSYAHLGNKGSQQRREAAERIRKEIGELQDAAIAAQKEASAKQNAQQAADAAISIDREAAQYRSTQEKRVAEITRTRGIANEAIRKATAAGNKELAESIAADQKQIEEGIAKKYKDPVAKKSSADREAERAAKAQAAEYERLNKTIDQHNATLDEDLGTQEKLTETQRFATKILSDLDNGYTKLDATQQQNIRTSLEELLAKDKLNQIDRERQQLIKQGQKLSDDIASDERRRASQADREVRAVGHSGTTNDYLSRLDRISDQAAEDRLDLARRTGELHAENMDEYLRQLEMIDEAERRQLDNEEGYFNRRKEAQADWRNGAKAAMEEIFEETNDVAGSTKDGWINAFQEMNKAIDTFAETGKFKIKEFAKAFIAELIKIELRILLSNVLSNIFGGGSAAGGVDGGANLGGSTYGYSNTYAGGMYAATGAVVQGGAKLATYALGGALGGIRSSATLFPMANGGTGLMGEAGPEGIVPLTRGPNGRLGVSMYGGGGGATFNLTTNVTISDSGTTSQTSVSGERDETATNAKMLGGMLNSKILEVLQDQRRQGGILWAIENGR
jgi:lambda family phage tail tape measure protein